MAGVPSNIQVVSSASESEYESVDFNACHKSNSNASLLDLVDSELARRFSSSNPVPADSENNYEAISNKPSILDDCSLIKKPVDTNANEQFLNAERDHADNISCLSNKSNGLSQKSIDSEQNEINKLRSSSIERVYDIVRPENSRLNGSQTNGHSDIEDRDSQSDDESAHIYENITFNDENAENEKPEDEQCINATPTIPNDVETVETPQTEIVKTAELSDAHKTIERPESPELENPDTAAESLKSFETVVGQDASETLKTPVESVNESPKFPPEFPSSVSELTFETWTTADDVVNGDAIVNGDVVNEDKVDSSPPEADVVTAIDVTDRSIVHDDVSDDLSCQTNVDNDVEQTEENSEILAEKKGKKKKNSLTETTCTTKTKKTKKTKKSEEKENISVITNGHGFESAYFNHVNSSSNVPSSLPVDDDLSNICVRNLKQAYCSEANKSSTIKHEEPVPPSIPIKELKSSFSKFDQLTKKTVLHVRSSDAAEAQNLVQARQNGEDTNKECKQCGKAVFVMEQIKAEGHVWHKNCFRCKTCNKQLTVDTYSSHEGELYCKPHFRELFKPKAVIEDEEPASDKPDLGLEELSSLDVKSRFQVFEKSTAELNDIEKSPSTVSVKRSPSILSKLAKFQAKGMDVGVPDESLNGIPYDESESSSDEDDESGTIRNSVASERPMKFTNMGDVKKTWEDAGRVQLMEERREERKQERQHLRSHLLMGKQGKMKELYEQAVLESERNAGNGRRDSDLEILKNEKARVMREKFERGEVYHDEDAEEDEDTKAKLKDDDLSVFEAGICKKSRSLFLEMDANVAKTQSSQPMSPASPQYNESKKLVRPASESDSPEREVLRDPNVVRADDPVSNEADNALMKSHTTSKMLSIFRQMEEAKDTVPDGPKPLKRFTPPPDYKEKDSESEDEETEEEEEEEEEEESEEEQLANGNIIRSSDHIEDEFLQQSRKAAVRARALKEKFEHWEPEKQSVNNAINLLDSEQASIEPTKNLRARFESMNSDQPLEKPRPRVNRFI